MFQDDDPLVPHDPGDRILLVAVCLLVGFFLAVIFGIAPDWVVDTRAGKLFKIVVLEIACSFLFLDALVLIWCIFRPNWIRTLLKHSANKVLATILTIFGGTLVLILYFTIRDLAG